jgi:enoyl-CoA hydratase/carnithine racemase
VHDVLLQERHDKTIVLTLNEPEARNPLSDALVDSLIEALTAINADPSVSCVVITGAGSAFCAGGNLKDMRAGAGMFGSTPAQMRAKYMRQIQRIPRAMYELEVPAIAAVNGPAVGAGCDLAMMCDLRIAATTASFAESFLRVGLISGDGGAWFLPRTVGFARACEMAFTAEPVSAEKAVAWGMVNDIVQPARLREAALSLAARITRQPPEALRLMKRLLRDGMQATLHQNLELAALMQSALQHSSDFREAVAAIFEKRPPLFQGQ